MVVRASSAEHEPQSPTKCRDIASTTSLGLNTSFSLSSTVTLPRGKRGMLFFMAFI